MAHWRYGIVIGALVVALLALAVACSPAGQPAADQGAAAVDASLTRVQDAKVIVVGTFNDEPHAWLDPVTGDYQGLDTDMTRYICEKIGVPYISYETAEWAGLIPGLLAKRWDVIADGMAIRPKRQEVVDFSEPMYQFASVAVVPPGNPNSFHALADFKGFTIGANVGSAEIDSITAAGAKEARGYKKQAECFEDIKAGRIDGCLLDSMSVGYALKQRPDDGLEVVWDFDSGETLKVAAAFRKEDVALREAWNKALADMKAEGKDLEFLQKWGLTEFNMCKPNECPTPVPPTSE